MRIIGGKLKGRLIKFVKSSTTRPLKDSVKENIFNIMIHTNKFSVNLFNSNVLDVFSGIGSFGIECISRGAKKVTFIEKNFDISNVLKSNLINLSLTNNSKLVNDSIENFMDKKKTEKYSIFFFDPPYSDKNFYKTLKIIQKAKIFSSNHIVIIHRERNSEEDYKNVINHLFSKVYGRSKIIFGTFI
tara:strand:+ start:30 stop:590 length:561 start_codon:yes stop_codon:yes gene_type:complete